MKLYSIPGTCALSVHIALEWIGAPFTVDVMAHGDNRTPAYLALNPSGQVPALALGGGPVLTEAAAILFYLADAFPEAGLGGGETPIARYGLIQLLSYLTGEVHVAFKPYFTPQRFLDDEAQFPELRAHAFTVLAPMLRALEARLGGGAFILEDRRSVADAYLYVLLRWAQEAPGGLSSYPGLLRFRACMERDPGVGRALAGEGMSAVGGR